VHAMYVHGSAEKSTQGIPLHSPSSRLNITVYPSGPCACQPILGVYSNLYPSASNWVAEISLLIPSLLYQNLMFC
jgi:hypothetical protein